MGVIKVHKDPRAWEGWPHLSTSQPSTSVRWPTHTGVTDQAVGLTHVEKGIIGRLLDGSSCPQPEGHFLSHQLLNWEVKEHH